jgi:hypothetical protein
MRRPTDFIGALMDLPRLCRLRSVAGVAGALLGFLAGLALLDGLIAGFHAPFNRFHVLAGDSVYVNGPLNPALKDLKKLGVADRSGMFTLSFSEIHKGFWLGGNMWRGVLAVNPRTPPGEYTLEIRSEQGETPSALCTFFITVHPDSRSLQQSSRAALKRTFGVSPFLVSAGLSLITVLVFLQVFLLSRKVEARMAEIGMAEIYQVSSAGGVHEVTFGLGARHGMKAGVSLALLDPAGNPCGTVEVIQVAPEHSVGRTCSSNRVKPGFRVRVVKDREDSIPVRNQIR